MCVLVIVSQCFGVIWRTQPGGITFQIVKVLGFYVEVGLVVVIVWNFSLGVVLVEAFFGSLFCAKCVKEGSFDVIV